MEIKLTADKKLLEALDRIGAAIVAALSEYQTPEGRRKWDDARRADEAATRAEKLATYETEPAQPAALDPLTALPVVDKEEPAPPWEPAEAPSEPAQSVPNREDVQRVAVTKIQGGLGKKVKALIEKHNGTRVSDVPEENLAAFMTELEALA